MHDTSIVNKWRNLMNWAVFRCGLATVRNILKGCIHQHGWPGRARKCPNVIVSTMANQLGECWWLLLHFILFCIFTKFFIICSLANILFLTSLRSKYSIWATGHTYSVTAYRDHQVNCLLQREAAHTVTTGKEKNWFFSISEMFVLVTRLQGSATFA